MANIRTCNSLSLGHFLSRFDWDEKSKRLYVFSVMVVVLSVKQSKNKCTLVCVPYFEDILESGTGNQEADTGGRK